MFEIIGEIIDEALKRDFKERKMGHYYISEIPYCLRKVWLRIKKPKATDSAQARKFQRGTILHDWLTGILRRSDKVKTIFNERSIVIPIKKGLILRGRLDNFIRIGEKEEFVIEVKSTSNINFTKEPSKHHILQIMPYMMIEDCKGIILYIDARTLETKEFVVDFDWRIWETIKERVVKLHDFLTEDKMPPPEVLNNPLRKWECSYCEYSEMCAPKPKKAKEEPINPEDTMFFL